MEEYKSFIRFANLYLYFSGGQQMKFVSMLLEKTALSLARRGIVGLLSEACGKGLY
ncbi:MULTISPECIES: hypothetical protein [Pseudomonas]|jgi:hypothetical protein|uniref:hypothetical protein n=1 Tax=Pseudomonas TaxID=286 RepID=UPI0012FDF0F2|nr:MULTISPECIES: hypothetical protein [Pseudomonas]WLG44551.1 hypothetical protein PSH69_27525 [Pseudomonas sp. FP1740]